MNTPASYATAKPSFAWQPISFQPMSPKAPSRASTQKLEISWKQMTLAAWSVKEGAKRFQQNESTKLDHVPQLDVKSNGLRDGAGNKGAQFESNGEPFRVGEVKRGTNNVGM